jgi:hypothetical protein
MSDHASRRSTLELDLGGTEAVPAILQMPRLEEPLPAVLLLHGYTSRKEDMASSIGRALYDRGVASLAIDLPRHGQRLRAGRELTTRDPIGLVDTWRLALGEAGLALSYLAAQPKVDGGRIGICGYSLGAYLSLTLAAADPRVGAIALTAGGDLPPSLPFLPLIRTFVDPRRAVRALGGRPLLLMNGTRDRRIPPALANALFEAAREPKEQRWYDGGHWPPSTVMTEVADWLASRLAARPSATSSTPGAPGDSSPARQPHTTARSRSRTRLDRSR